MLKTQPTPPIVQKIPKHLKIHDDIREDHYYWLSERDNPEVIAHLKKENAYTDSIMTPQKKLCDTLYKEMRARIKEEDQSVPYRYKDYYYGTEFKKGQEYPVIFRQKGSLEAKKETILDINQLAEGHEYYSLSNYSLSHDQKMLAYAFDLHGNRINTIHFKNLETGELLTDEIPKATGEIVWANDNQTIFYSVSDSVTLRTDRIFRHQLGQPVSKDVLVYEEKDETFDAFLSKSKDETLIFWGSGQTETAEEYFFDANDPNAKATLFLKREKGHVYSLSKYQDHFYILSNKEAKNYRLFKTPIDQINPKHWQEIIPHRKDVMLEDIDIFKDHLVAETRQDGLTHIVIYPWSDFDHSYEIEFNDPAYTAYMSINPEFETEVIRYGYTSLTTPGTLYEFNMKTKKQKMLKQQPVLGGFDANKYQSERLYVKARDGVKIPVSLVYHKEKRNEKQGNPLLLYAYGAYGSTIDPSFNSNLISLLDRGFVFAIAHIRGGQIYGRQWYEEGRQLKKKNTFYDYIDVAKHLTQTHYAAKEQLFAMGGSAGGLLMGAVLNMAPECFAGAVAQVPFVDVITTMTNPDLPLTTGEYDEWGNPNDKKYYDYMKSYSPYDNIQAQNYPPILATTGFHDSQVQYFEPAKWVAKLREIKTDNNPVLLKINLDVGHGGASGRFEALKDDAFEYAFLLMLTKQ